MNISTVRLTTGFLLHLWPQATGNQGREGFEYYQAQAFSIVTRISVMSGIISRWASPKIQEHKESIPTYSRRWWIKALMIIMAILVQSEDNIKCMKILECNCCRLRRSGQCYNFIVMILNNDFNKKSCTFQPTCDVYLPSALRWQVFDDFFRSKIPFYRLQNISLEDSKPQCRKSVYFDSTGG